MSCDTVAQIKEKILSQLIRTSAFRFTSSRPPELPYSIDLMRLAGSALALKETAIAYQMLFRAEGLEKSQRITGLSPSGETFAALLAYLERKPLLWLGGIGTALHRRITGLLQPGDSVLLVDGVLDHDVLMDAALFVRAEGGLTNDAIVLVGASSSSPVRENGVDVHALFSLSEIVNYIDSKRAIVKRESDFLDKRS